MMLHHAEYFDIQTTYSLIFLRVSNLNKLNDIPAVNYQFLHINFMMEWFPL